MARRLYVTQNKPESVKLRVICEDKQILSVVVCQDVGIFKMFLDFFEIFEGLTATTNVLANEMIEQRHGASGYGQVYVEEIVTRRAAYAFEVSLQDEEPPTEL